MTLRPAHPDHDRAALSALWLAYLRWANDTLEATHGVRLGLDEDTVAADVASLDWCMPPHGGLLLAQAEPAQDECAEGAADPAALLGSVAWRHAGEGVAELRRLYVRPQVRGTGVGRDLLRAAMVGARAAGYTRLKLDCPDSMHEALALFRAHGFVATPPDVDALVPPAYWPHWVFMERRL